MPLKVWVTSDGKPIVSDNGAPIVSPRCPCVSICEYCCEGIIYATYVVTLGFTAGGCPTDPDNDPISYDFSGNWTVYYMGYGDNLYCVWTTGATNTGFTYNGNTIYAGVTLDFGYPGSAAEGTVQVNAILTDTTDMAYFYSSRVCYYDYPYECLSPSAYTSTYSVAQFVATDSDCDPTNGGSSISYSSTFGCMTGASGSTASVSQKGLTMACQHKMSNGTCALGLYGGLPSPGVCRLICDEGKNPDVVQRTKVTTSAPVHRGIVVRGCKGCAEKAARLRERAIMRETKSSQ